MKIFENNWIKILVLFCIVSSVSCKKYLDLKPQDGIIRQNFWKTKEQVQAAMFGCYSSLLSAPPGVSDKPLSEYLFLWGELRGGFLTPSTGVTPEELDILNTNILASNSLTTWRAVYRTINYCNTLIEFAPEALVSDKTFTQDALNAYTAEAKTLRALMYFYLVRTFRDVPLKLKPTSSDQELDQLPKNTAAEVLDQIVKDLSESEQYLPTTYNNQAADKGRVTRYTLNAIQADVALWMEKYPQALAACDKIINSGRFGLIQGPAWFSTVFGNGNSNESIFEFQYDRLALNSFYVMFRTRPRFVANNILGEEFFPADGVNDLRDIRYDGGAVDAGNQQIWKYIGASRTALRAQEESFAHWIVYRYADVLLMKAEALALTGKGQEALEIVERIRLRANALVESSRNPDPSDVEGVLDYILDERAREFAFEGKRWYDLLRHAKRNNYKRLDILTTVVSKSVPADRQQSAIAKLKDINSHYLPINQYELQTDKNLVQNPFYK